MVWPGLAVLLVMTLYAWFFWGLSDPLFSFEPNLKPSEEHQALIRPIHRAWGINFVACLVADTVLLLRAFYVVRERRRCRKSGARHPASEVQGRVG